MYRKDCEEIFTRLREYDSVSFLIRKSFPKKPFTFPWLKAQNVTRISCFDVHEDFIAFGWSNGSLSIFERNGDGLAHSFGIERQRNTFLQLEEDVVPTWLALRETDSLVIVCSCVCSSKRSSENKPQPSKTDQSVIFIYRIPVGKSRKLLMSKMVRHVIKGIHHNPVFAPLYVSPLADVIVSGDIRGSVVHSRYNQQLCTYHSGVLTVVPGSLTDLKLVQGSLLLLTCRAFPQDRLCDVEDDDAEVVEIVQEPEALYFLYDIPSRNLARIDLTKLLPPHLNLTISCSAPVWLPKQSLSKPLRFICSVDSMERTVSGALNDEQIQQWLAGPSGVVAVVFAVHDHLTVSLERLIVLQSDPFLPAACRIPVLTSVVSTANTPSPRTALAVNADDSTLPHRRLSCSSSTDTSRQSVISGMQPLVSASGKRLSLFSDRTLILWSTESSSSSFTPNPSSVLAFLQLDLFQDPELPTGSTLATSSSRLLAYSTQLGPITSIAVVPLKPWSGPLPPTPADWMLPRGGCGGLGLEVWVQRELPDRIRDKASPLVLLSTRPLCVSRLAISPFADLHSLFTDQKRDRPNTQQSLGVASGSLGSVELSGTSRRNVGIEQGVDALEYLTEQLNAPAAQPLCTPEPKSITVDVGPTPFDVNSAQDSNLVDNTSQHEESPAEKFDEPPITLPDSGISTVASNHPSPGLESADSAVELNCAPSLCQLPSPHQLHGQYSPESLSILEDVIDSTQRGDHNSAVQTEHVQVTPESVTDGSCVSCIHDEEANDAPLDFVETTRQARSDDDTWFVFSGPPVSGKQLQDDNAAIEQLLSNSRAELVPLTHPSMGGGRPGLAVFDSERVRVEWIMAPKAFGEVQSFHVSPNGFVVWCLRKSTAAASDGGFGYSVDVFLDKGGIRALARAWIADQCGHWEQDVLRRVTSLDLSDHRAIFSNTSGNVKIQFDLSPNRPYCQSYTWPCPEYHVHQVTLSSSGVVWALASTRSTNNHDSAVSLSRADDLCLLSAFLPDMVKTSDSNSVSTRAPSSTTPAPSVIKSQLKSSQWIPLALPSTIQPALNQLVSQATTMLAFSSTVNSLFQLALTKQHIAFGPLTISPPSAEYTMGWLVCTTSNTTDLHGCAFLLPNLNPPYKADDTNWYEVAIDCPDSRRLAGTAFQMLMKRMNLSNTVQSVLRFPTHVVQTTGEVSTNQLTLCPDPLWVLINRPTNDQPALLVKRLRSSLTAYRWRKYRLRMQSTNPTSPSVNEQYDWRFPILIDGLVTETVGKEGEQVPDCCLWTLNTVANELFCHLGPRHTRSLPVPESSNDRDAVKTMCLVRDHDNGVAHLLVATQAGYLWSRLGLSSLSPVGTTWVSEAVPGHWASTNTSRNKRNIYCRSAVHVNGELWITDSSGSLASTRVELLRKSDGTCRLLSPQWTVHASPSPTKSDRPGSGIHFLAVSGSSWNCRQQGDSLWAVGIPARDAVKLPQPISDHTGALVYARCWCPDDASFVWSYVPAPPARSIHVSEDRVWLVSNTQPRQIYLRYGLTDNSLLTRSQQSVPTPAPLESEIGHAWHSIPLPDPIQHTFDVQHLVPAFGKNTNLGGHRIDALCLAQSGTFLSLFISRETLMFGPTRPDSRSRSTSIARPAELIALSNQASPVDDS